VSTDSATSPDEPMADCSPEELVRKLRANRQMLEDIAAMDGPVADRAATVLEKLDAGQDGVSS